MPSSPTQPSVGNPDAAHRVPEDPLAEPQHPRLAPTPSRGRWGSQGSERGREQIRVSANTSASQLPALEPSRPRPSFLTTWFQTSGPETSSGRPGLKSFPVAPRRPLHLPKQHPHPGDLETFCCQSCCFLTRNLTSTQGQREAEEKDIRGTSDIMSAVKGAHPGCPDGCFRRVTTPKKVAGPVGIELNRAHVNKKWSVVQGGC